MKIQSHTQISNNIDNNNIAHCLKYYQFVVASCVACVITFSITTPSMFASFLSLVFFTCVLKVLWWVKNEGTEHLGKLSSQKVNIFFFHYGVKTMAIIIWNNNIHVTIYISFRLLSWCHKQCHYSHGFRNSLFFHLLNKHQHTVTQNFHTFAASYCTKRLQGVPYSRLHISLSGSTPADWDHWMGNS